MSRAFALLLACFLSATLCASDGPRFEAASVKISAPIDPGRISDQDWIRLHRVTGGPGTSDPGRFHGPNMGMMAMLTRAFGVKADQIQGPKWLSGATAQTSYDVDATMPPGTTKAQFQQMFQNLLIERFHLAFHHETRNFPGYALVVDTGGPKISEVSPDPNPDPSDPETFRHAARGDDGFAVVHGPAQFIGFGASGKQRLKFQEHSIADFVDWLGGLIATSQGKVARPGDPLEPQPRVVDRTGLAGKYTFILEYYDAGMASAMVAFGAAPSPEGRPAALPGLRAQASPGAGGDAPTPTAAEPAGVTDIFTAVRKQLGLRLDKTADVPVDVIVVESADKTPVEN